MKTKKMLVLMLMVSSCSACSFKYWDVENRRHTDKDYKKLATGHRIFDGDPEPVWPGDKNHETLEGIDSDNDGIRDDIEIWINSEHKTRNSRLAVKQIMRTLNNKYITNTTKEQVLERYLKSLKAIDCYQLVARTHPGGVYYFTKMYEHGNSKRTDHRIWYDLHFYLVFLEADKKFKELYPLPRCPNKDPSECIKEYERWRLSFCDFEVDRKENYINIREYNYKHEDL